MQVTHAQTIELGPQSQGRSSSIWWPLDSLTTIDEEFTVLSDFFVLDHYAFREDQPGVVT